MRRLTTLFPSEFLSDEFQARHEERAGPKLHLLHNVTDETIERIDVTDEKPRDSTLFKTGSWVQGRLVLPDLAYVKCRRFALNAVPTGPIRHKQPRCGENAAVYGVAVVAGEP